MHGLSASSLPSPGAAPGQATPYLTPGQGAGAGNGQVAWQQEAAPPPAFAEPFHPVNMARRAMLDQVNPMASVLGAQQLFSMGWPGQQGWGGAPGWNPGSAAMMWPSAAVAGYQQPHPGFGGISNPHSASAPPAHLGGAGGLQQGLGFMPNQAQAPFLQPGGVPMAAAQFQPGYAGLQHIPGVDATYAGAATAALPPNDALRLQQLQAQQWQQLQQQRPTPGTPPLSVPLAPTAVAAAAAARKDGAASPDPRPGPPAEAAAADPEPVAGGRPRRSRPRSSKTASEERVVPEGAADRAAGKTLAKVPTRKQRSAVSTDAPVEAADAVVASKSPQERLKLSQPGRPAATAQMQQQQQQQRVPKRQRRSPVAAALLHEAQAAMVVDKPPLQVGRSAAAARRRDDNGEQRKQAAASQPRPQDGVGEQQEQQQQQRESSSVAPLPQAAAPSPAAATANLSAGQGLSNAAATLQRLGPATASQQQLHQQQQQQQQQFAMYQQQLLQQQLAQQQQQQIAAAAMYFQQQQLLQGSYPSSGTPVPTAGGAEPGKDAAAAGSPAQRTLQPPQTQPQQMPQMPHPSMQQPQMPNFGYPAANPYMAGFSPVMNPFLALGRGPFDPLMAWYMAHYGTTGLMPDMGFPVVSGQVGGEVMSTPNAQVLARQASQQHSVRRASGMAPAVPGVQQQPPAGPADAVPSAAARPVQQQAGPAHPPARTAVRWWQDPKLTFGPPGDPEFLAKIPDQDRPRPPRLLEENAAVAATCSGPDSGSGEVTSKLRNPGSAETGGMDPSIGGGYALTVAGAAPPDAKPAATKQKGASPRAAGGAGVLMRQRSCEARPAAAATAKGGGAMPTQRPRGAAQHVPDNASPPSANGTPRQACGATDPPAGDGASPQRNAPKQGEKKDCKRNAGSLLRAPNKDKHPNGLLPNGSGGGMMTSGQRLLAAQSGASTLDPRPSDD